MSPVLLHTISSSILSIMFVVNHVSRCVVSTDRFPEYAWTFALFMLLIAVDRLSI
ncbi:hypothetical protein KKH82_01760 [Patescibacteria group bacterium]|nr:hypothetical protein [Patescibacteria group bacterium]